MVCDCILRQHTSFQCFVRPVSVFVENHGVWGCVWERDRASERERESFPLIVPSAKKYNLPFSVENIKIVVKFVGRHSGKNIDTIVT